MVPARSHKPITRVQIPLSQFRCRRSSAGKEQLFRKQQAAGSKPAAGFQTYDRKSARKPRPTKSSGEASQTGFGAARGGHLFCKQKAAGFDSRKVHHRLKAVTKRELYTQLSFCCQWAIFCFRRSISLSFSASTASYLLTSVSVSSVSDTIFDLRIVTLFESSG